MKVCFSHIAMSLSTRPRSSHNRMQCTFVCAVALPLHTPALEGHHGDRSYTPSPNEQYRKGKRTNVLKIALSHQFPSRKEFHGRLTHESAYTHRNFGGESHSTFRSEVA